MCAKLKNYFKNLILKSRTQKRWEKNQKFKILYKGKEIKIKIESLEKDMSK